MPVRITASLASAALLVCLWAAVAAASGPPLLPSSAPPSSLARFPCPRAPISTIDIEACAGHRLLVLDRGFDADATALWPLLDATARAAFARASSAWLVYRTEECRASARVYLGGTAAGIDYADCENELTAARLAEVADMLALYCQGSAAQAGGVQGCAKPHAARNGNGRG